jgi:hypothetical protein
MMVAEHNMMISPIMIVAIGVMIGPAIVMINSFPRERRLGIEDKKEYSDCQKSGIFFHMSLLVGPPVHVLDNEGST